MKRARFVLPGLVLLGLVLLALAFLPMAPAAAQDGCLEDGALHRPEVDPPLPEAAGAVLVRAGGRFECLEIHLRGVPAELPLFVTLHGGDRVIEMGAVPPRAEGRELIRCNGEGDTLPGEVRSVSQLFEYEIVVSNEADQVVLSGRVPVVECRDEPGDDDEPEEEALPETVTGFLQPPPGSASGAAGKISLLRHDGREVFRLDLAGLPEREISSFHLEDGTGGLTQISAFYVPDFGAAAFLRDTAVADDLPLDAAALAELEGRGIEIRDEMGDTVLVGDVPAFGPLPTGPLADGSARNALVRPEAALLPDASGTITVTREDGEERLEIQVDRVRPFHDLALVIERVGEVGEREGEGDGPLFVSLSPLQADGSGSVTFVRDTADGETLPLGGSLGALANVRIQIFDPAAELVVLHGVIPPVVVGGEKPLKVSGKHVDEITGAIVSITGRMNSKTGRDKLSLDMRRLPKDDAGGKKKRRNKDRARLFFEDGAGQMVEVRDVPVRAGGRARMRFRTKRGDALPGGASSLRELSGRVFEIRVGNTLAVRGFIPFF